MVANVKDNENIYAKRLSAQAMKDGFDSDVESLEELTGYLDSIDKLFKDAWDQQNKRKSLEPLGEICRTYNASQLTIIFGDEGSQLQKALLVLPLWVENKLNEHTRYHLDKAANLILKTFSQYMPTEYCTALRETFCNNQPNSTDKQYGYAQHDSSAWFQRFQSIGIDTNSAHEAKGMTIRWDGSEQGIDKSLIRNNFAPYNSVIEVKDTSFDTLVHEMLHWVTHDSFEKFTRKYKEEKRPHDTQITREGTTEWLKRFARNNWDKGGYTDVFPEVDKGLRGQEKVVEPEELMKAYFGGKNVEDVCEKLIERYHRRFKKDLERTEQQLITRFPNNVLLLNRIGMNRNWNKEDLWALAKDWPESDISLLETQLGNKAAADYVRNRQKDTK